MRAAQRDEQNLLQTRSVQPDVGADDSNAVSELRIALSDARALNRVAREMIAHPDLGVLLQTVVSTVAEALPAERVSLITFDLEGRRIEHFVRGGPGAAEIALSVGFDELTHGLSGWVLREGRPALSPAGSPDPRELPDVQRRRRETHCGDIIVVPLTYLDRTVGTMTAINPPDGETFTERQVDLMMAMASHAALAINTATLYDRLGAKTVALSRSLEVEVAARRRAEQAEADLAASRAQLEFALRSHALGAWAIDIANQTTTRTLTHDQIFGYDSPPTDWNWSTFMSHVLPEDRELIQQSFDHAVATQGDWSVEFRIRRVDGAIRNLLITGTQRQPGSGGAVGMQGLLQDITERKRTLELQQQISAALEAAPTGMLMVDQSGTLVMVNAKIESLFGYSREELLGRSIEVLVPAGSRDPHRADRGAFQAQPVARTMGRDVSGLHKDGREMPLEVGLSPIHTSRGDFVIASVMDISSRVEVDRMRSQFISTVSHELRTPLTSIAGSLGLLHTAMLDGMPDKARRMIDIAYHNSNRLVRIINDVLDVGKLESGQFSLRLAPVHLVQILREAVEVTVSVAAQTGVRLVVEPAAEEAVVLADADRLIQVLTNLLSNAIKFSPNGAEVRIRALGRGDRWRVEVEDFGIGIPPNFRARIFTKFAQADSTPARRAQGTGLGLHIAQQLISRMNGSLDYTSVQGQGSTFYFDLPKAIEAEL